jgi:hypothetical protein
VPHDKLLIKLEKHLPMWLVKWIAAYLSNRRQQVQVGQTTAEWMRVEAGVIQGSVLGPVLFLLYIYDINSYLPHSPSSNTEKYADDIISYIIGKDVRSRLPQDTVDAVERWCDDNMMKLNVNKCDFKSLVLSHFRYSGILLDPCTERTKDEMQHFQNKLLRIIGMQRDEARTKYGVEEIRVFIERTGMEQTLRVLNSSTHSLPASLLSSRKSHSAFPFTIPRTKTTKFNESMVLKALRHTSVRMFMERDARLLASKPVHKAERSSRVPRPEAP